MLEKTRNALKERLRAAGMNELTAAVVSLGLIAIIGAVVLIVLAGLSTSSQVAVCTNGGTWNGASCSNGGTNTLILSPSYNAIGYGITGISTIMQYLPLIALVIVAAVIITIVVLAFAFGGGRHGAEL